jgi:hypothetical protein
MEVAYSLDKFPSRIRKMIKTPPVFWQFSTTSRVSTMNTTRKRKRSKKEKKEKKKKQKKLGTPKDKIVRVAEAVEESGPMVYKSLKSKRSKKEKKKKKEKLEAPKDKTVSATQVAEAVEKYGQMVYESLKPSVRRQLAKDYGLWVGRKDKKWVVQLDPPRSVEDVVRDMLETDEQGRLDPQGAVGHDSERDYGDQKERAVVCESWLPEDQQDDWEDERTHQQDHCNRGASSQVGQHQDVPVPCHSQGRDPLLQVHGVLDRAILPLRVHC